VTGATDTYRHADLEMIVSPKHLYERKGGHVTKHYKTVTFPWKLYGDSDRRLILEILCLKKERNGKGVRNLFVKEGGGYGLRTLEPIGCSRSNTRIL
jgi:hypothetical protein